MCGSGSNFIDTVLPAGNIAKLSDLIMVLEPVVVEMNGTDASLEPGDILPLCMSTWATFRANTEFMARLISLPAPLMDTLRRDVPSATVSMGGDTFTVTGDSIVACEDASSSTDKKFLSDFVTVPTPTDAGVQIVPLEDILGAPSPAPAIGPVRLETAK